MLLKVKNIEKYHPGYQDRVIIWAKIHVKILNDVSYMGLDDIDRVRYITLILLQLQNGRSIPADVVGRLSTSKRLMKHTVNAFLAANLIEKIDTPCNMTPSAPVTLSTITTNSASLSSSSSLKNTKNKKQVTKETDNIDSHYYNSIKEYWNKAGLQECRLLSVYRLRKLKERCSSQDFRENWKWAIDKLAESSFANGLNDRGWKAHFNWFIHNDDNYTKALEGNYDAKQSVSGRYKD